jgi:hypothetical protein
MRNLYSYSIILASLARNSDRIDQNIGLDKLPIAHGAEFDNYIHQHEDKCLPGTRTDLLHQISEWTISLDKQAIFWLHGEAGTGKSTIARTAAKSFKQANLLGATFFFKRGEPDRGNASKVFSTVADQLVRRFPQLRSSVREAIANDPMITSKSLREQFDRLLLQPLLDTELLNPQPLTIVMVFDALDECESDSDIRVIIQSLSRLQEASAFRLRVLLTSRPELSIRLEISKLTNQHYLGVALHDIPESVTEHDISLFLTHRLSQIREIQSLPSNWPGDAKIQALVKISVPLFIFAATVCRIFEDSHWDPVESLDTLLTRRADGAQMNGTYLPILDRLLVNQSAQQKEQLVQEFRVILGTIVILELPLPIRSLSTLTGLSESKVKRRLNPLHSVIRIPEDKAMPINLYHLSFRDFLLHPETRGKTLLWVDKTEINQKLATQCLSLTAKLKRNICGLSSDGILRADIDAQKINCSLSSELQYSCRFWAHHALQTKDPISMLNNAFSFLQKHLLHWVEAMILLDCGSDVLPIIDRLLSITQVGLQGP